MRLKKELIDQLGNSEIAVKGNGKKEDTTKLQKILKLAFPLDFCCLQNKKDLYYRYLRPNEWFAFSHNICTKAYEIDDFFEEEFNPQFGDLVMVSQNNTKWYKRHYVGNYKGINYCVSYDDDFLKQNNFYTNQWKYIKPLKEEEEEEVRLTLKDISNGKGVGVPPHLIRVKS